jgi:hypothetical protein
MSRQRTTTTGLQRRTRRQLCLTVPIELEQTMRQLAIQSNRTISAEFTRAATFYLQSTELRRKQAAADATAA